MSIIFFWKCIFGNYLDKHIFFSDLQAHNRLVAELDTAGFDIAETQSFATEVRTALTKLKEKDIRIILGNFNETWAIKIFCEAYQ